MKKLIKTFISSVLILSLVFQTGILGVSANDYVGDGGGSSDSIITGGGVNWGDQKQGVRVSIVDKDGKNVLTTSSGEEKVIDILFSNPGTINDGYGFYGNKFSGNSQGKSVGISVADLNVGLIESISQNPEYWKDGDISSSRLQAWSTYCSLPKPTYYSNQWVTNYTGMPAPLYFNSANDLLGNGKAVKEYFIKGSLGSRYINSTPDLTIPSGSSSSSGSSSVPKPSGGSTGNSSSGGTEKIYNSAYGRITESELDAYIDKLEGQSAQTLMNNGMMKASEVSDLKINTNSMVKTIKNRLSSLIAKCNAARDVDEVSRYINNTRSEIYSIKSSNLLTILDVKTNNDPVTYEYMRAINAVVVDICTQANSLLNSIQKAFTTTSTLERTTLLSAIKAKIPKFNTKYSFSGINIGNAAKNSQVPREIDIGTPIQISADVVIQSIVDSTLNTIESVIENSDDTESIKNSITAILRSNLGTHTEVVIEYLGGIDKIISDIKNGNIDDLNKRLFNAIKKTETAVSDIEDALNDLESSLVTEDGEITLDELGKNDVGTEVIYTADSVKQLLVYLSNSLIQQGFGDATYDKLLSTLDGTGEDDKLNKAAIVINKVGAQNWANSLNLDSIIHSNALQNIQIFDNQGYIGALLDIKDSSGNYMFNIEVPSEMKQDYLDSIKAREKEEFSGKNVQLQDRPSYRFSYMGYGIVLEPIVWVKPIISNLGKLANTVYGTVTNWARWFDAKGYNESGHPSVFRVASSSMYIDEEIPDFFDGKVKPLAVNQVDFEATNIRISAWADRVSTTDISNQDFSFGWHFAGMGGDTVKTPSSSQVTWKTGEPSPGKAPDPSGLPDPSINDDGTPNPNNPGKVFKIVKYYEDRDYSIDPNIPMITKYGPKIRENNPNIIQIVDEPDYVVEDWFTGEDKNIPREDDTTSDYYSQKQSSTVIQQSNTNTINTTVTLDKGNTGTERVLYVLLVKRINGSSSSSGVTIRESQITKAIHTNSSISGSNWGNYSWSLEMPAFRTSAKWYHSSSIFCSGHSHKLDLSGGGADNKITTVFDWMHTPKDIEIGTGAAADLSPKIYSKEDHEEKVSSLSGQTFNYNKDGNDADGADYVTVLWRYNDVPTLASYKESDIKTRYGTGNWDIPSTILPAGNVSALKRISNGNNTFNLSIEFGIDDSSSDFDAKSSCYGGYNGCYHTDSQTAQLKSPSWTFDFVTDVDVDTYRGTTKPMSTYPFTSTSGNTKKTQTGNHFENTTIQCVQPIEFYPYIKMTYQINSLQLLELEEKGNRNTRFDTYVLSEQESSLLPNDAVEVGWENGNEKLSMNISSQQWSLHQKAVNGSDGWQGANQVLPGGAIYQLDTGNSDTVVKLVTYQTVVDGKTRNYLSTALNGDEYTEQKVEDDHKSFIDMAREVLDNLRAVQWVNKNVNATNAWPTNWDPNSATSEVCITGGGVSLNNLGLSGQSSSDTKYHMQDAFAGQPGSEGDLDIITESSVVTAYKIFTDTAGNVYMATLSSSQLLRNPSSSTYYLDGVVDNLISQLENVNADSNNTGITVVRLLDRNTINESDISAKLTGDAKIINDRTKIISNIVTALERGTGRDNTASWATNDGKWYNEAFDGIYLVRQSTSMKVGFNDPTRRTAALDPALCPSNAGQSDLYSKAFLSQFCMNGESDAAVAAGKGRRFIGTFKGQDITLPDMEGLYQSRKFYIPNANVQDNH